MDDYIKGNKAAWEEAFDLRDPSWGSDIVQRISAGEPYAFFDPDMAAALAKHDLRDKSVAQFCCNNGRELLSLVSTCGAAEGIGFDIAENQIAFANEKAKELALPCTFVAENILEIRDEYRNRFDAVIITIGALCWFKDLALFFAAVSRCMKAGAALIIHEQHPFTNMLAPAGDAEYDGSQPLNCVYSYFEREWIGSSGMYYMTRLLYESKTFTEYTHSLGDILTAICSHEMVISGLQEYDYDISGSFANLDSRAFPLSLIIEGRKLDI